MFRARWRSIALLAVALVVVTVVAVAGTATVLVPGIALTAAVALGAMVAPPPDPVAVEGRSRVGAHPAPAARGAAERGLFNDATALVVFQAAVLADVGGDGLSPAGLGLRFVAGAAAAVLIGLAVAWVARTVLGRLTDTTGRSALTLVLPFATYLLADELGASGVIAVVVLALQLRRNSDADEAPSGSPRPRSGTWSSCWSPASRSA